MKHLSFAVVATAFAGTAFAATTSESTMDSILKRTSGSYYSGFEGPSARDFSNKQGTAAGEAGAPVYFYNILSAKYQNSPKSSLKADFRFTWTPNDENIAANNVSVLDPRIQWTISDIKKWGNFSMDYVSLRQVIPALKTTRDAGNLGTLTAFTGFSYDTGTKFGLAFGTATTGYAYTTGGERTDFASGFYPSVNYQVTPNLTAEVEYYHGMAHTANAGQYPFLTVRDAYAEPQVMWKVSKAFTFAPYFRIHTMESVRSDRTQVGFEVWGSIF